MMAKESEIQRERELNLQLQDEKYHAITKFEGERDRNFILDKECANFINELTLSKGKFKDLQI